MPRAIKTSFAVLATVLAGAAFASPAAEAATTKQLLRQAGQALKGNPSAPSDLTPILKQISARLPGLSGAERREAQHTVSAQRDFLRLVLDSTPNLIYVRNRDGRFTLANQAVADLHGTTVDDLLAAERFQAAGAVAAQQGKHAAPRHGQRDLVDRGRAAIAHDELVDHDRVVHHPATIRRDS